MSEYAATVRVTLIVEADSATEAEELIGDMLDAFPDDAEVCVRSSINATEVSS